MADPEKHSENDDPENIGDDTEFLKGGIDAGSDLDELTFEDDELVDLSGSGSGSIDQILGSPLESLDPLQDPSPTPQAIPSPVEDPPLLDEQAPASEFKASPIPPAPSESPVPGTSPILDQALPGKTKLPSGEPPLDVDEGSDPIESAGNQRLDPSRRRPRPRPRPRQRSAPAEDEIIFDDEDEFATPPLEQAVDIPPAAELPPPDPEPPADPEPVVAPVTTPDFIAQPEPEPLADPAPDLEPLAEPELEYTSVPDIPPVGLGEIDDEFENVADVLEPPLPPESSLESPAPIDPTPVPDFRAMAQQSELPKGITDTDDDDFEPLASPPEDSPESAPRQSSEIRSGDNDDADELSADDIAPPPAPRNGAGSPVNAGKNWFGQLAPLELASLIVIAVGCILGIFLFNSWSKSGLPPRTIPEKPAENVPSSLEAKIVQISSLEAYWRTRNEEDPSKITSGFLPELKLTLGGSTKGYLLAIFRDAEGQLVGTADHKVDAGKFVSTGSDTGTLTSPVGLDNEFVLATYRVEEKWRWQVTLKESVDKEDWTEISRFYFPADSR